MGDADLDRMDARPWPDEVRRRGIAAGYDDVLVGKCDVEGVGHDGERLDAWSGPRDSRGDPAIWGILREMGVPTSSAGGHWCGLSPTALTAEQRRATAGLMNWVCERPRCEFATVMGRCERGGIHVTMFGPGHHLIRRGFYDDDGTLTLSFGEEERP